MAYAIPSYLSHCLLDIGLVLAFLTNRTHIQHHFPVLFSPHQNNHILFPKFHYSTVKMRFASLAFTIAAMLALGSASPARNRPSKSQIQDDLQALADVEGTDVDPNLPNGTILVDNGQGRCVASSGKAVCSGISG